MAGALSTDGIQKRRIHVDGFQMLETKHNESDEYKKMLALEARVRRLEYEEKRAQKLTSIAEKRHKEIEANRKKHELDMDQKRKYNEMKVSELNAMREKINQDRQARAENIQKQRLSQMGKNFDDKVETNGMV